MEDTKQNRNNCGFGWGIEIAITRKALDKVVEKIKEGLESTANEHEYEGSAEQFLMNVAVGYMDKAMQGNYSREMNKLPTICKGCRPENNCYKTLENGMFSKREPQN